MLRSWSLWPNLLLCLDRKDEVGGKNIDVWKGLGRVVTFLKSWDDTATAKREKLFGNYLWKRDKDGEGKLTGTVAVSLSCEACDGWMWQLFSNWDTHTHTQTVQRHAGSGTPRHLWKYNGPSCLKRECCERKRVNRRGSGWESTERNTMKQTVERECKNNIWYKTLSPLALTWKRGVVSHLFQRITEQLPHSVPSLYSFNQQRVVS